MHFFARHGDIAGSVWNDLHTQDKVNCELLPAEDRKIPFNKSDWGRASEFINFLRQEMGATTGQDLEPFINDSTLQGPKMGHFVELVKSLDGPISVGSALAAVRYYAERNDICHNPDRTALKEPEALANQLDKDLADLHSSMPEGMDDTDRQQWEEIIRYRKQTRLLKVDEGWMVNPNSEGSATVRANRAKPPPPLDFLGLKRCPPKLLPALFTSGYFHDWSTTKPGSCVRRHSLSGPLPDPHSQGSASSQPIARARAGEKTVKEARLMRRESDQIHEILTLLQQLEDTLETESAGDMRLVNDQMHTSVTKVLNHVRDQVQRAVKAFNKAKRRGPARAASEA